MRIIITGATGFVGRSLLPRWLDSHEIAIVVRHIDKAKNIFSDEHIQFINITDEHYQEKIKAFNATVLVHLATFLNSKERSDINIHEFVDSNILFGTQILNSMVGTNLQTVINVGTCLEYRNGSPVPVSSDLYSATKTAFRSIIAFYQNLIGFKWINVIPFSIYGQGAPKIVLDYICEALDSPVPIKFTKGDQIIDLVHIDDVIGFFDTLLSHLDDTEERYQEFEIGTTVGISIKDLVSIFEAQSHKKANIDWGGLTYSELASMCNVARPEHLFEYWNPKYSLNQAVEEYLIKHRITQTDKEQ